jgi:hypothetical protein
VTPERGVCKPQNSPSGILWSILEKARATGYRLMQLMTFRKKDDWKENNFSPYDSDF